MRERERERESNQPKKGRWSVVIKGVAREGASTELQASPDPSWTRFTVSKSTSIERRVKIDSVLRRYGATSEYRIIFPRHSALTPCVHAITGFSNTHAHGVCSMAPTLALMKSDQDLRTCSSSRYPLSDLPQGPESSVSRSLRLPTIDRCRIELGSNAEVGQHLRNMRCHELARLHICTRYG